MTEIDKGFDGEPILKRPICIYRGGCEDGFTAAWVVHLFYKGQVDLHAGHYGQEPPDTRGRDVIIVDFSYPRDTLLKMADADHNLLLLDHHKTAQKNLENIEQSNINIIFDMDYSGAMLTWSWLFRDRPAPAIVRYTQDRDLWHHALPWTREINAFIKSIPHDMAAWYQLVQQLESDPSVFVKAGIALVRMNDKVVTELCGLAVDKEIDGHVVPVVNAPWQFASDVGNKLSVGKPFAATYIDGPEGRQYSLRSQQDGLDVSEIAKKFGGGGHRNAAGYKVAIKRRNLQEGE